MRMVREEILLKLDGVRDYGSNTIGSLYKIKNRRCISNNFILRLNPSGIELLGVRRNS